MCIRDRLATEWLKNYRLEKEKEVSGIYISGHPLDEYRMELENYITFGLEYANQVKGKTIKLGGIISSCMHGISQKNNMGYARLTMQDYTGSFEFGVYREEYLRFKDLLITGNVIYMEGIWKKGYSGDRHFFTINDIRLMASLSQDLTLSLIHI